MLAPDKTPQPSVPVRIEKRGPAGSWVTIARTTTDADGAFVASAAWTRGGLARATALQSVSLPVSVGVVPARRDGRRGDARRPGPRDAARHDAPARHA